MEKKSITQTQTFFKKKSPRFPVPKFPEDALPNAINMLIYGSTICKYSKAGNFRHRCVFYILEDDSDYLQWLSSKKEYIKTRINLKNIKNIYHDPSSDSKILKIFKHMYKNVLFVNYEDENSEKDETLVLKFSNEEDKLLWWQGMSYFIKKALEADILIADPRKNLARKLFLQADKNGDKRLNVSEIRKILISMQININKTYLDQFFMKYDLDNNNVIDFEEFQKVIEDISHKPELLPIFKKYAGSTRPVLNMTNDKDLIMCFEELQLFFKNEQKQISMDGELEELLLILRNADSGVDLMEMIKKNPILEKKNVSFLEFTSIIFSMTNSILDPHKAEIYQDLDHPLTDYFINSSHNTYLTANQLTSQSNTKAYIDAFEKGCRCIELDCWDGDKEPIIYHGFTLTSKILFEDVIKIINDYGFIYNPYPIILSFENHCKWKNQERMAEILKNTFGERLYLLPPNYLEYQALPSPNELKNKVLIKDKGMLANLIDFKNTVEDENEIFDEYIVDENEELEIEVKNHNFGTHMNYIKSYHKKRRSSIETLAINSSSQFMKDKDNSFNPFSLNETVPLPPKPSEKPTPKKHLMQRPSSTDKAELEKSLNGEKSADKILCDKDSSPLPSAMMKTIEEIPSRYKRSPGLLELISLFAIKMKWNVPRSIWNISSVKETNFQKFSNNKEKEIIDYHKSYLTRIYPTSTRVDSSNFCPLEFFNLGVQMVALNVQTCDIELLIYLSKFLENGGSSCGYVLKPDFYQKESKNPKYLMDFRLIKKILIINVLSGQQLGSGDQNNKDPIDPYVEVSLRGIPVDDEENSKIYKTNVIKDNGFNPVFELECQFKIACPELAFLIFQVFSEDQGLIKHKRLGWYSIPFTCIRQGYRLVPLYNDSLNIIEYSCLLCKIEIKDVPA